jgi:DNA gyrase/topoisomerase IV subunit A
MGVTGIKIKPGDRTVGMKTLSFDFKEAVEIEENEAQTKLELDTDSQSTESSDQNPNNEPTIIVITEKGFGKQTVLSEYRQTHRATSGVKTINITTKTGNPAYVNIVTDETEIIVTTQAGITIKTTVDSIRLAGRATQGVTIIKLDKGDKVVSCALV